MFHRRDLVQIYQRQPRPQKLLGILQGLCDEIGTMYKARDDFFSLQFVLTSSESNLMEKHFKYPPDERTLL